MHLSLLAELSDTDSYVTGVVFLLLGICIYRLPAIMGRKKRNANAIAALNIRLGWTFVGWVVALVWAMTVEPPAARRD